MELLGFLIAVHTLAPAAIFSEGKSEVHQWTACKGVAEGGRPGSGAPGRQRSFQKLLKKLIKNFKFLTILMENFGIFQNVLKLLSNFSSKILQICMNPEACGL